MDGRLFQAACTGDVAALQALLQQDSLILARISPGCAETPLHVASLLGHTNFAREILRFYPAYSQQLNQDGYSPLHLASSNGHKEMVKLFLEFGHQNSVARELCMNKDRDERTPLHCAVIRGRVDVISELTAACPESVLEVTVQRETILHLAVNQLETFSFLVQGSSYPEALLNWPDNEGNTVLHVATVQKQVQIIRFLTDQPTLDVNALNNYGLTALDLLVMGPTNCTDSEIGERIRSVGGVRHQFPTNNQVQPTNNFTTSKHNETNLGLDEHLKGMTNGLLIMASLFATITFQIVVSPPGGFWQDWGLNSTNNSVVSSQNTVDVHLPGTAILFDRYPGRYKAFLLVDTFAFLLSLSLILALLGSTPAHLKSSKWIGIRLTPMRLKSIKWKMVLILTYALVCMIVFLFGAVARYTTERNIYSNYLNYGLIWPCYLFLGLLMAFPFLIADSKIKQQRRENEW